MLAAVLLGHYVSSTSNDAQKFAPVLETEGCRCVVCACFVRGHVGSVVSLTVPIHSVYLRRNLRTPSVYVVARKSNSYVFQSAKQVIL